MSKRQTIPDNKKLSLDEIRDLLELISENNLVGKTKEHQEELLHGVLKALRDLAVDSFYVYVLLMGPLIVPEGFKDGRHIEVVCNALQSLYESIVDPKKKTERLQIFLPPRAMKSRMGSILFPSWVLGKKPDWNIICVGNSVKFAEDEFGRNVRDLLKTPAYRYIFPKTELRSDAKAVGLFTTTAGGKYLATGAGASLAGRGAHLVICDDVLSEQTALSKAERSKINKWYVSGLRSRLSPTPQGGELIINTRWALDDLSGYTIKIDEKGRRPWKVISIPAILDSDGARLLRRDTDPQGSYEEGCSFWPEFQPMEELLERRREFEAEGSPDKWHALYMQALAVDTPVPTPTGWSTIGDLKVGDYVLGGNGKPTKVINKTEVYKQRDSYRVTTNDGASVVADKDHLWQTKVWRNDEPYSVRTTQYLVDRFPAGSKRHPRIPVSGVWDFPEVPLKVDPYILGLWLGDGNSNQSVFTATDEDQLFYKGEVEAAGYVYTKLKSPYLFSVTKGFQEGLRQIGVLGGKKIPIEYLRASEDQRIALLQGLMDTDGTCQNGQSSFANTNLALIESVKELVLSLGGKPFVSCFTPKGHKTCYKVSFYLENCFRLPRKAKLARKAKSKHYRFLSFEYAGKVDTQCITVEAEDGLFLAGTGCMVTHNCPIPPSGNIIKFEDWNPWKEESPPTCSQVIVGFDTAFSTSSKADFSAYVVLGVFPVKETGYRGEEYFRNHAILLQAGRGRWDFGTLCDKVIQLNREYNPDVFVIEKRASGQSLIQEMKFRGVPIYEFITDKDKESRLNAVSPLFKAKTVWYPEGDEHYEWTSVIIDEVCTFPVGANDDLTDALSSALLYLRENMSIVHPDDYVVQSQGSDDEEAMSFGKRVKTYWSTILKEVL